MMAEEIKKSSSSLDYESLLPTTPLKFHNRLHAIPNYVIGQSWIEIYRFRTGVDQKGLSKRNSHIYIFIDNKLLFLPWRSDAFT